MNPSALFQFWWNSRTSNPTLFYAVLAALLLLLAAIRLLFRRKKKSETVQLSKNSKSQALNTSQAVSSISQTQKNERLTPIATSKPGLEEANSATIRSKSGEPSPRSAEKTSNTVVDSRRREAIKVTLTPEEEKKLLPFVLETAPPPSTPLPPLPHPAPLPPKEDSVSTIKYIGYNPINIFAQSDPLHYPYVLMPAARCVIKFPRKGRQRRKGYKEDSFKAHLEKYFSASFQIFDNRHLTIKGNTPPFEPDLVLIKETEGINLFVDIEIDEPYEGSNDIAARKAIHYQQGDGHRNQWFVNRGWIVIRLAEIQIHQHPDACCRFIADVIKAVDSRYTVPSNLIGLPKLSPIKQWTKSEAEVWSAERYRERYLGITSFGLTVEGIASSENFRETALDQAIEAKVVQTRLLPPKEIHVDGITLAHTHLIEKALREKKYISLRVDGSPTIVQPLQWNGKELRAFCYVKNEERAFRLSDIRELHLKELYYSLRLTGPTVGVDKIKHAINMAIMYHRYIRMKYTRSAWSSMEVDPETGEVILDIVEAEESMRTISDVQLAINALAAQQILHYNLDENYIRAYCHRREAERTFKFSRIGEMEILDI